MKKILRKLMLYALDEDLQEIRNRLTSLENTVPEQKQVNAIGKAVKGIYDLVAGVIQIGGK